MLGNASEPSRDSRSLPLITLFLFFSGLSALVYQTVWLREFRLIFGASTPASAAVLAIFMGGLGAGSLLFGRREVRRPVWTYGVLEVVVSLTAALTPFAFMAVRWIYLTLGGSQTLGSFGAAAVRLLLSALVLAIPTVCMGGTLPTIVRRIESGSDRGRAAVALVYGVNTVGAVAGVLISTFYALEHLGSRSTLWITALVNLLVGLGALLLSMKSETGDPAAAETTTPIEREAAAPLRFVLAAAAVVGAAFFLMELVWYRMLIPLLGGTTFTFGLILAMALLGIGIGSELYAIFYRRRPATSAALAWTCALEALFIAVPFALGDGLAVFALLLRELAAMGFSGLVLSWTAVCAIVILPAAIAAGFQFPLLVALLGEGREDIGRHVGYAYAWNTGGAIVGAIAGGFGLLPLLSATGVWKLVVGMLALVSLAAAMVSRPRRLTIVTPILLAAMAVSLLFTLGPTAAWRHSPIGFGRADQKDPNPNSLENWLRSRRRAIMWERDGVESSIAVSKEDGLSFLVNGKVDGHSRLDAGTQIMGGLLGLMLYPQAKSGLVIGLGTGSSAGWLAAAPEIERVDVVELEPAVLEVAKLSSAANHDVLQNPKVHIAIGDAREVLLASKREYDIIFSEPSNPARAGIASLFTTEFYRAVDARLREQGLFLQWLQAYEVDAETVRTVYATLTSVFPHVETWQTKAGDLVLVAGHRAHPIDVNDLSARLTRMPFADAVAKAWKVNDVPGFVAHFVAGPSTALWLAEGSKSNTDDRTIIEYAFARTLGRALFDTDELWVHAKLRRDDRPLISAGRIDWRRVAERQISMRTAEEIEPFKDPLMHPVMRARAAAHEAYYRGSYLAAMKNWLTQPEEPTDAIDLLTWAESLASTGDERAVATIQQLPSMLRPVEQNVLLAMLRWQQSRWNEAADALAAAFTQYRSNPWPLPLVMTRALNASVVISKADPSTRSAEVLYEALREPFALHMLEERRLDALLEVADRIDGPQCGDRTIAALKMREPWFPWAAPYLEARARCYEARKLAGAEEAASDLAKFRAQGRLPLDRRAGSGMPGPSPAP
jgi:spermidine synthase